MRARSAAILCLSLAGVLWMGSATAAEQRISMELEGAPVRPVLRQILQSLGANYILDPQVKGTVTLRLYNVPAELALQAVLEAVGCESVKVGGALFIRKKPEPQAPAKAATNKPAHDSVASAETPATPRAAQQGQSAPSNAPPTTSHGTVKPGDDSASAVPEKSGVAPTAAVPYFMPVGPGGFGWPMGGYGLDPWVGYGFIPAYPPAYAVMTNSYLANVWVPVGPGPIAPMGYGWPPMGMTGGFPFLWGAIR